MKVNFFNYKVILVFGLIITCVATGGCSTVRVVDKTTGGDMIQESFTTPAIEIKHELDTYDMAEELLDLDSEVETISKKVKDQLINYYKTKYEISDEKLKNAQIDVRLYQSLIKKQRYFVAVMVDDEKNVMTTTGILKDNNETTLSLEAIHTAYYFVNAPKTYVLEGERGYAVVSQRPYSTFEECYLFREVDHKLVLEKTGWRDYSLDYYRSLQEYFLAGKFEEAIQLEDFSQYPMSYEKELFTTAQIAVDETYKFAKSETSKDSKKKLTYLEWALNFYFQNHYSLEINDLIDERFKSIKEEEIDNFGYSYILGEGHLKEVLNTYADLLAHVGQEKKAQRLKLAMKNLK